MLEDTTEAYACRNEQWLLYLGSFVKYCFQQPSPQKKMQFDCSRHQFGRKSIAYHCAVVILPIL